MKKAQRELSDFPPACVQPFANGLIGASSSNSFQPPQRRSSSTASPAICQRVSSSSFSFLGPICSLRERVAHQFGAGHFQSTTGVGVFAL